MGVSRRPIDKQKPQRMGHCGFFITHNPQEGLTIMDLNFTTPYRMRVSIGDNGRLTIVQEGKAGTRSDVVLLDGDAALSIAQAVVERLPARRARAVRRAGHA